MDETGLLQHWMKTLLISHGSLQHKLQKTNSMHGIDEHDVVAANGGASVYERLNVYSTGYLLRLLGCLGSEYSVLRSFMGEDVFNHFGKAYLLWKPSGSYTLYELGREFSAFLKQTRPPDRFEDPVQNDLLDLPAELAVLERARQEVLRAEGSEGRGREIPSWGMESLLMQPLRAVQPPCLRLIELSFPLAGFYEAVSAGREYDIPLRRKSFIAVSRKNYRVTMEELPEWQFRFLGACRESVLITEALETAALGCGLERGQLFAELYVILPFLMDNGFIMLEEAASY